MAYDEKVWSKAANYAKDEQNLSQKAWYFGYIEARREFRDTMNLIAAECGLPDSSEACRQILKTIRDWQKRNNS